MKKFLSVILALAIVIVPVGAVFCFADEEEFTGNDQYIVLYEIITSMGLAEVPSEGLGKVELIADMDQSSYTVRAFFYAENGQLLKIQKLREGSLVYEKIKEYIEVNYFTSFDIAGILKYSKVRIGFIMGYPGYRDIGVLTARTYDEISGSRITSFYKLFSLKSCPEIIDKLGIWHQLICAYLLFANPV